MCEDLVARKNRFRDCLTSVFQYCNGLVPICPVVNDLKAQKRRCRRNIRIGGNDVETFDVPLRMTYRRSNWQVVVAYDVHGADYTYGTVKDFWGKRMAVTNIAVASRQAVR